MMRAGHDPIFPQPENLDCKIWRYVDFTRFISMLEHKALYFCRDDKLGDPFEGSVPVANWEDRRLMLEHKGQKPFLHHDVAEVRKAERKLVFVSCWHMNQHESAAMWKLYAKTDEAIAIQSTYSRLLSCTGERAHVGVVTYIDYETERIAKDYPPDVFMYKRRSFEHEQEVRALIVNKPKAGTRLSDEEAYEHEIWNPVNLEQLVQTVYVAPSSPAWFKDLVEKVVSTYELNIPVAQSSLDRDPLY